MIMMAVGFWKILWMMINRREISFKWLEDVYAKRLSSNGWMMDPTRDSLEMAEWRIRQANLSKFLNDGSAKRVYNGSAKRISSNAWMLDPPKFPQCWFRRGTPKKSMIFCMHERDEGFALLSHIKQTQLVVLRLLWFGKKCMNQKKREIFLMTTMSAKL